MSVQTAKEELGYIVGIGASAGGLEAVQEILKNLDPETGNAYVIIQHLSSSYKSMLVDILTKYTDMPVTEVTEPVQVRANQVYVISPKYDMKLEKGMLTLTLYQEKEGVHHPIDAFFRSLAKERRNKAIAVVMSGTGSDGSAGIKAVKEANGYVVVQTPESAKFDGMPQSAIRTGAVDFMLSPREIGWKLSHFSDKIEVGVAVEGVHHLNEVMRQIFVALEKISGINYTYYKKSTILRRIKKRMIICRKSSLVQYAAMLEQNTTECRFLAKELLIGVTGFFRDAEYFARLKESAITGLVRNNDGKEPIRVWVAGCSTGEEAYSVAILFAEVMAEMHLQRQVKIFASDVDLEAVTIAGRGCYTEEIISSVSKERLSRYFSKKGREYTVIPEIRRMLVFAPHNILSDPPFGMLDLITCRNMLIYFQPMLQKDVYGIFHCTLKDKGYLFLGKSETVSNYADHFIALYPHAKIFYHKGQGSSLSCRKISTTSKTTFVPEVSELMKDDKTLETNRIKMDEQLKLKLLEQLLPACVVIDEADRICHSFGTYSRYVRLPLGKITLNLYEMLTAELRLAVLELVKKARLERRSVTCSQVAIQVGEQSDAVDITVLPLPDTMGGCHFWAIAFDDSRGTNTSAPAFAPDEAAMQRIQELERELGGARQNLQAAVGELESTNEELQAANEELLTANEELQSSNEELQSVNEELYTVNNEYQTKLVEVTELNDDMTNFLSTNMLGILFVDNKLEVRKFTSYVADELEVAKQDVGRTLERVLYNIDGHRVQAAAIEVLETLQSREVECQSQKGNYYMLRLTPYRTGDNKILGVVISIVDITEQKREQLENNKVNAEIKRIYNFIPGGVFRCHLDENLTLVDANDGFYRFLGYGKQEFISLFEKKTLSVIVPEDWGKMQNLPERLQGEDTLQVTLRVRCSGGCLRWVSLNASLLPMDEQVEGENCLYCMFVDITEQKAAERQLLESKEKYRLLTENMGYDVWEYDLQEHCFRYSRHCIKNYGLDPVLEGAPQSLIDKFAFRGEDAERFLKLHERIAAGEKTCTDSFWVADADGNWGCKEITYLTIFDEDGKPVKAYAAQHDVTRERELELQFKNELDYRKSMEDLVLGSFHFNLTKNLCDDGQAMNESILKLQEAGTVDGFFAYGYTQNSDPELLARFRKQFNRQSLLDSFAEGRTKVSFDHKYYTGVGKENVWIKSVVHMMRNPLTQDVEGFIYAYNIQREKLTELLMNSALNTEYDLICAINWNNGKVEYCKTSGGIGEGLLAVGSDYNEDMKAYLQDRCNGEDCNAVVEENRLNVVAEALEKRRSYTVFYDIADEGGELRKKKVVYRYLDKQMGIIALLRSDITDVYESEQEKNRQLAEALQAARLASSAKSDFLARMSHEIRTPMNAIMGLAELAGDNIEDKEFVKDCLHKSLESSRYLLSLINDILDMSRVENGRIQLEEEPMEMDSFFDTINTIVQSQTSARKLHYRFSREPSVSACYLGDSVRLKQILLNILNNSIKFTKENGRISLTAKEVKHSDDKVLLQFEIADSGIGITPRFMPQLFKAFSQENNSSNSPYAGTGLGLAISKNLANLMGGDIKVESFVGVGTTMTVTVWVKKARAEVQKVERGEALTMEDLQGKRILLAEDHPLNAAIAVKLLESKGMQVEKAVNGKICVDKFMASPVGYFDLILMDIRMPEMDGLEAAAAIRGSGRPDSTKVPIVAMTANAFAEDRQRSKEAGMNGHLAKPIEPILLYKTLMEKLRN